jgi:hypothetical protein
MHSAYVRPGRDWEAYEIEINIKIYTVPVQGLGVYCDHWKA